MNSSPRYVYPWGKGEAVTKGLYWVEPVLYMASQYGQSVLFSAAVISRESGQGIPLQQSVSKRFEFLFICTNLLIASIRVNIGCGRAEERFLLTGLHAVADIYCNSCKTTLGWKYVSL